MAIDFTGIQKPTSKVDFSGITMPSQLPAKPTDASPTSGGFKLPGQDTVGSIATGFAKGIGSTVMGLVKGGRAITTGLGGLLGIKEAGADSTSQAISSVDQKLTPQGGAENVGYYGEKGAEFLTPGGIEKSAISAGDKAIEGLNLIKKLGPLVGKTVSTALKGTVRALTGYTSGAVVGTAQTGDVGKGNELGITNAIASPLIEGVVSLMPKAAEALQKVSMRLTPSDKRVFANKLSDVTQYMLKNNVVGTAKQQSEVLDGLFTKAEDTLQKTFEANPDKFVSKSDVKLALDKTKEIVAKDNPDAAAAIKQVDDAKANLDFQYGQDKIPLSRFNELKRNTFGAAFNRAGTKVLGDVEFAIGDAYKSLIEKASEGLKFEGKDIGAFNKDYGSLITGRKLMAAAESKSPKLFEKVISTLIGGATGSVLGPIGATAGAVAGLAGGQLVEKPLIEAGTSIFGNVANRLSGPTGTSVLKAIPKIALPALTQS